MPLVSGYECDKCGKYEMYIGNDYTIPSKIHLINLLRRDGWTYGKKVLCPKCKRGAKDG